MNRDEIFQMMKDYFISEFEVPENNVELQANLFEDLGLDSIDALDMVSMLEAKLDIEVDESEIGEIRTIENVIDFVLKKLN